MKKSAFSLIFALLLCGLLAACGGPESPSASVSSVRPEGSGAGSSISESTRDPARQAYAELLTRLMEEKILPDGTACDPCFISETWDSTFTIADVDGDGREELVLCFLDDCVAGQHSTVLEYIPDTAEMREELHTTADVSFYDSGAADSLLAHNQTRGVLWPFFRWQYQPETDTYRFVGSVDSWDREVFPEDYPEQADTSGSGSVYYISEGPSIEERSDPQPVDVTVYEQWETETLGGARLLKPDFLALNEQNIRQITEQAD